MTAILNFLRDEKRLSRWLFWYWMISPFVFFLYTYVQVAQTGTQFREALNQPNIALSFLTSCMSIVTAYLLKVAHEENAHTERSFSIFTIVQQLLVGNLVGFLLSFFLARALWLFPKETFAPSKMRWVLIGGMVLLSFLTLLTLIARYNQWFGA